MELQIALDRMSYDECFETLEEVSDHVDIIEVGTGVIKEYGLGIVRDIKDKYKDKKVLADIKICDAGRSESEVAFSYGADIVTVMSFADRKTIMDCLEVASGEDREVVVDLLNHSGPEVLEMLKSIGAASVSAHIGKDQQGEAAMSEQRFAGLESSGFKLYVAGGINEDNLTDYMSLDPAVVIVGSGITKAADKKEKAARIRSLME